MKHLFRIFELSRNEQRVVLIVMFTLIIVAFVGYERHVRRSPLESALSTQPKPSPTAMETVGDQ
jgi:hypothetical protein